MRQRQLEFLQLTANPIDMQIIGPKGRAHVLKSVSQGIGMDGDEIVPADHEIEAQQASAQAMAMAQGMAGHAQQPPQGAGGPTPQQKPRATKAQGPQTNVAPARVTGGVG
jgi:hypothetical protein